MRTTISLLAALLAAVTLGSGVTAHAEGHVEERIETYAISGKTGIELYQSIGERGPNVGIGRAIAFTDFDLTWRRDYRPQPDGSCILASARPRLVITYRLPRPAGTLAEPTKSLWATFIAGVEKHERVHGEIIRDMTRRIEAASVGLTRPDDRDCNKVRAALQAALPAIVEERNARNRDFDRKELSEGGAVHQLILALVDPR